MKKTKLLALTLVVAIMLVGAGYAAWTDIIQVDTYLETGKLKVDLGSPYARVYILDEDGTERIADDPPPSTSEFEDDAYVVKATPTITNNALKFEFKNLYPGTRSYTQWYATNTGTVTATVEDVVVEYLTTYDVDSVRTLENELEIKGIVQRRKPDASGNYTITEDIGAIPDGTKLAGLDTVLEGLLLGKEIRPDEQIFFTGGEAAGTWIQFTFPDNDNTDGDAGENEKLEVKITMDFIQYNLSEQNTLNESGLKRP